jgi:hypothetical protein
MTLRNQVVAYYSKFNNPDPLITADGRYVLWRASGIPDCSVRDTYRKVAGNDRDVFRRLTARAILAFGGPECGEDNSGDLKSAAKLARQAGLPTESKLLQAMSSGKFRPHFEDVGIVTSLKVPPNATTMILGESTIELTQGMRIGTQVDRVGRDWISFQMRWDLTGSPLAPALIIGYHEGNTVKRMADLAQVKIYPLTGTIMAQRRDKWFGPDETGTFRFEILKDKTEYPTTHTFANYGWIEDTHGISALVSQALERGMQLVVGCGDSEGKAKASFYLAQKGVNVFFPGDRYQDLLVGYQAKGTLLGTAPIKKDNGRAVIGHQPVRFSLREPIVVEDTKQYFPIQYYDAGARYFRRLSEFVHLNLDYVNIQDANQIEKVLERAAQLHSTAVAVRVVTDYEYEVLLRWLESSPDHRAILFHSSLYPHAQSLFDQFPQQVTFGDLHPRFE